MYHSILKINVSDESKTLKIACLIFSCPTGCVAYIFKNFNWFEKSLLINVAYKTY